MIILFNGSHQTLSKTNHELMRFTRFIQSTLIQSNTSVDYIKEKKYLKQNIGS